MSSTIGEAVGKKPILRNGGSISVRKFLEVFSIRSYIRSIELRFKFEVNCGVALTVAATLVLSLAGASQRTDASNLYVITILLLLFAVYLFGEAWSSHGVLADRRSDLLQTLRAKMKNPATPTWLFPS